MERGEGLALYSAQGGPKEEPHFELINIGPLMLVGQK